MQTGRKIAPALKEGLEDSLERGWEVKWGGMRRCLAGGHCRHIVGGEAGVQLGEETKFPICTCLLDKSLENRDCLISALVSNT